MYRIVCPENDCQVLSKSVYTAVGYLVPKILLLSGWFLGNVTVVCTGEPYTWLFPVHFLLVLISTCNPKDGLASVPFHFKGRGNTSELAFNAQYLFAQGQGTGASEAMRRHGRRITPCHGLHHTTGFRCY